MIVLLNDKLSELPEIKGLETVIDVFVDDISRKGIMIEDFNKHFSLDEYFEPEPSMIEVVKYSSKKELLSRVSKKNAVSSLGTVMSLHKGNPTVIKDMNLVSNVEIVIDTTYNGDGGAIKVNKILDGVGFKEIIRESVSDRFYFVHLNPLQIENAFFEKLKELEQSINIETSINIFNAHKQTIPIDKLQASKANVIKEIETCVEGLKYLATIKSNDLSKEALEIHEKDVKDLGASIKKYKEHIRDIDEDIATYNELAVLMEEITLSTANVEAELLKYRAVDHSSRIHYIKDAGWTIVNKGTSNMLVVVDNVIYSASSFNSAAAAINQFIREYLDKEEDFLKYGLDLAKMKELYNINVDKYSMKLEEIRIKQYEETKKLLASALKENRIKGTKDAIQTYTARIGNNLEEVHRLQARLQEITNSLTIDQKNKALLVAGLGENIITERFILDIMEHENFDGVYIDSQNGLAFKLKNMMFKENGRYYKLPEQLYIAFGNASNNFSVTIVAHKDQLVSGYNGKIPHPHAIYKQGGMNLVSCVDPGDIKRDLISFSCCWGDPYQTEVPKLAANKDYSALLDYVAVWLKLVNSSDAAGAMYSNWALISDSETNK